MMTLSIAYSGYVYTDAGVPPERRSPPASGAGGELAQEMKRQRTVLTDKSRFFIRNLSLNPWCIKTFYGIIKTVFLE
jgi:hypothetical protein